MKKTFFVLSYLYCLSTMISCSCYRIDTGIYPRRISISLIADKNINNNNLLQLEIIVVKPIKASIIKKESPDRWFASNERNKLYAKHELYYHGVIGGYRAKEIISVPPDTEEIIVYADFEKKGIKDEKQQLYIPLKKWFCCYEILIRKDYIDYR